MYEVRLGEKISQKIKLNLLEQVKDPETRSFVSRIFFVSKSDFFLFTLTTPIKHFKNKCEIVLTF